MNSRLGLISLSLILLAALSVPVPAQAQYRSGWGGWGGATTAAGSSARGMGVLAAGAGSFNEQTAEARSMNVNTAMQANEYMYQSQQRRNQTYYANQAAKRERTIESADTIQDRLRNHPEPRDVHTGDALNIVLDDLNDPQIYMQSLQAASQPIPSPLVKNVPFEYAANAITISLEDLTKSGVPDVLLTTPAFEPDRTAFRAIVTQARKEAESGPISAETLAKARATIATLKSKVDVTVPDGPDREAADNYLKALTGLTKMLQQPDITPFLQGLNQQPTTTLGHLLSFMNSFNLRFGVAKTPMQESTYDQLYPMLVALRDQVNPQGTNASAVAAAPQDPSKLTNYFSSMQFNPSDSQPAPSTTNAVPPPPAAGNP